MSIDFKTKKSIQKRLLLQNLLQITAAMILISFTSIFLIQRQMEAQAFSLLQSRASSVQERLEQRFRYLTENTQLLAKHELMINSFIDADGRKSYLPHLVENFIKGKDVVSLSVIDFDGKAIFSTQKTIPSYNKSAELRSSLALGHTTTYIDEKSHNIVIITPIEYYATTQGALLVHFDLKAIALRNFPNQSDIYTELLYRQERVLEHNKEQGLEYKLYEAPYSQRTEFMRQLNLSLKLGLDKQSFFAPIQEATIKLALISIILILIGAIASIYIANEIAKPIMLLYARVKDALVGNSDQCYPLGTDDELDALAKAFDERTLQLQYQAQHDTLTKLPNRALFVDRLEQAIKINEEEGQGIAVLFLDLDRFKEINDSFGHQSGDLLLMSVATELDRLITPGDTVSRMGGDEFTMILRNVSTTEEIVKKIDQIMSLFTRPMKLFDREFFMTCSIGIALYPQNGTTVEELLKNADAAMYKAKQEGRNTYQFYTEEMTRKTYERLTLNTNLRRAIENDRLDVYFQPQVDMRSGKISGMEALVRWIEEDGRVISPAEFIPLAEETGLIVEIDRFVMREAMAHFSRWYHEGYDVGVLSVNLSMVQLKHSDFVDYTVALLHKYDLPSELLMLEITETQIMKNPEFSIKILAKLKMIGIRLSIDDFGTGHSSLSYLTRLPVDKVKIDQSFVRSALMKSKDTQLIRTIIAIANNMKLDLLAEGVETKEEAEFLVQNGCFEAQGYLYFRPAPYQEVQKALSKKAL